MFEYPDKTLFLVFDILHITGSSVIVVSCIPSLSSIFSLEVLKIIEEIEKSVSRKNVSLWRLVTFLKLFPTTCDLQSIKYLAFKFCNSLSEKSAVLF